MHSCRARRCSYEATRQPFNISIACACTRLVAGGDDAAAVMRPAVFPGGHDAAGAFDDRDQRQHVVRLKLGLDDEIDMAGGEHAIGIAIAAIARQPHRLLNPAETAAGRPRSSTADWS